MNKFTLVAILVLLNMLGGTTAFAVTCSVGSSGIAFGSFNPLSEMTVDSTGTITVTCDASASYTIALSPGGSGTFSPRRMSSSGHYLAYNLYRDAGYNQIWGDGTGGSYTIAGLIPASGSRDHTVYGRIPVFSQRSAMVGSYSDSITITVTY